MKANHVPVEDRLKNRIEKLQNRAESFHVKSPDKGNPYYCCKECGIHDPQVSINKGKHFPGCNAGGIPKEIEYYKSLLDKELNFVRHVMEG